MERISFDDYFMEMAHLVSKRSTCLRRQVGAVLVKDNHVIATGYNGASKGATHCDKTGCLRQTLNIPSGERHEICKAVHAEQNAIIQAAYYGIPTNGSVIYVTVTPCFICAKMLVNAGIKEVIINGDYPDNLTLDLFKEVGIKVRKI